MIVYIKKFDWREKLVVPIMSALVGGGFVLFGVILQYNYQRGLENERQQERIYSGLHTVMQEIAENFEFCYENDTTFIGNATKYHQVVKLQGELPEEFLRKPVKEIENKLDGLDVYFLKPNKYYEVSSPTRRVLEQPQQRDTLLYSIYSMIKKYYNLVSYFNSRCDLYFNDHMKLTDRAYIDQLSIVSINHFFGNLALQERLLSRTSLKIYEQGKKCMILIDYYLRNNYLEPHPPIVSIENESIERLMLDTLFIERYKPIEIVPDTFLIEKMTK